MSQALQAMVEDIAVTQGRPMVLAQFVQCALCRGYRHRGRKSFPQVVHNTLRRLVEAEIFDFDPESRKYCLVQHQRQAG